MKSVIVYYSKHHGNTKKLLDKIAVECGADLIDATEVKQADLSGYDLIGFASGIYYSKFQKSVLDFAEQNLPEGKRVFFIYTCGSMGKGYTNLIEQAVRAKNADIAGTYGCKRYDTFGPFKLVGGIAKGHPDGGEIVGAVEFFKKTAQQN